MSEPKTAKQFNSQLTGAIETISNPPVIAPDKPTVDWLSRASRFDFSEPPPEGMPPRGPLITIERTARGWHFAPNAGVVIDGHDLWCVSRGGDQVLNKKLEWEWQPLPSSRTEAFIKRTRWASYQEAWAAAEKEKEKNK